MIAIVSLGIVYISQSILGLFHFTFLHNREQKLRKAFYIQVSAVTTHTIRHNLDCGCNLKYKAFSHDAMQELDSSNPHTTANSKNFLLGKMIHLKYQ